jgi:hypothetical protein
MTLNSNPVKAVASLSGDEGGVVPIANLRNPCGPYLRERQGAA